MKRFTATILAMGLAAAVGTASAQSSYGNPYYGGQPNYGSQPNVDRYGQTNGAYYDYARVLRVDPVINSGYGNYPASGSQRCHTRQDGYAGNDGYVQGNGNGYYGNDGYGNNGYSNNGYSNNGYSNNGYSNNGYSGYGNDYGNQPGYGSNTGRTMATVIGGVLGAAIGSQVGGGSARYATSAIGSMVGGIAGRQVYENAQRQRQPRTASVTVCDPVPADGRYYGTGNNAGASAYDVTYEYGGRSYTTRTNYNPGSRIRVRVDVRPE